MVPRGVPVTEATVVLDEGCRVSRGVHADVADQGPTAVLPAVRVLLPTSEGPERFPSFISVVVGVCVVVISQKFF